MKKYKVGITFGAYDPLHYGHIKLFERAKEQCEMLVVCVSTNSYIIKHKNREERIPLASRMKSIEAIKYVNTVTFQDIVFGKKAAILRFKPDVIFVGSNWTPETFTGEGLGVPVIYLPYTKGMSSTQLVGGGK